MSAFEPVRSVRLYERIVEQVEEAIAAGRLRPGEHLPSERELVTQTGASRATVREALRVLESHGVVRSRHGDPRGPEVLAFTPGALSQQLTKQLTRLASSDDVSLAELIGFRMILDSASTLLAAAHRTAEQLEQMENALADMEKALDGGGPANEGSEDGEAFSRADVAFHDAVAEASGNRLVQVCNTVVREVVLRLIATRVEQATDSAALMRRSLAHHSEVLDAVRAGTAGSAASAARRTLYDYYAGYVPVDERAALRALADDGTRTGHI